MNYRDENSSQTNPAEETDSDIKDTQRIYPQIRIQRIDDAQKKNDTTRSAHQTIASTTGEEERPPPGMDVTTGFLVSVADL